MLSNTIGPGAKYPSGTSGRCHQPTQLRVLPKPTITSQPVPQERLQKCRISHRGLLYVEAGPSLAETAPLATPPGQEGTISGIWLKDEGASDMRAYERSLTHCMRLGGLQRETALRLFEGLHISQTADGISLRYLTVVPFFQITETFSFSHKTSMKRRDARQGDQTAQPALPLHRGVAIVMDWGPPLAGHLEDLFTLEGSRGDTLHCRSRINVEGRTNQTLQVFRRANEWKPRFSWPF